MKHSWIAALFCLLLVNCQNKSTPAESTEIVAVEDTTVAGKQFEMYQMSEMSLLMEQMFADHQRLKDQILNGEPVGEYPTHYDKIHTAELTVESDRDLFFDEKANEYLAAHKLIYEPNVDLRSRFNQSVDACIVCHREKCGGPIGRIQKLYIP